MKLNTEDILKLSALERVRMMETIWDVMTIKSEVESPDWHEPLLQQRRELLDSGEMSFIKLSDLQSFIK